MAKLPALVDAIAEVDGRDRATIDHVARVIREAGYIPTTKRGSGASEMTAREAANLLLALKGADAPKDGPLAIDRFRSLRQEETPHSGVNYEGFSQLPIAIKNVAEARTFGEALEALIDGAPELSQCLRQCVFEAYGEPRAPLIFKMVETGSFAGVEVTLKRYQAEVALWRNFAGQPETDFITTFLPDLERQEAGFYGAGTKDHRVAVGFGFPTLIHIAQTLSPDERR
ncbi:hypothetical protein [Methylocystis echinoides]|nr:hypothetical protein [Methylocystis echinoides]